MASPGYMTTQLRRRGGSTYVAGVELCGMVELDAGHAEVRNAMGDETSKPSSGGRTSIATVPTAALSFRTASIASINFSPLIEMIWSPRLALPPILAVTAAADVMRKEVQPRRRRPRPRQDAER